MLNSEFLQPLSETQQKQMDEILPLFNLDTLLGTLFEIIQTRIRHFEMEHKQWK